MAQTPVSLTDPDPLPELAAKQPSQTLDVPSGEQTQGRTTQRINSQEHEHRHQDQDLFAPAIS
jgi:hypothetical protein